MSHVVNLLHSLMIELSIYHCSFIWNVSICWLYLLACVQKLIMLEPKVIIFLEDGIWTDITPELLLIPIFSTHYVKLAFYVEHNFLTYSLLFNWDLFISDASPKFNKTGIMGKGKNIVTKHDATICGRKNTEKAMDNVRLLNMWRVLFCVICG